jgi:four helix bundle protein
MSYRKLRVYQSAFSSNLEIYRNIKADNLIDKSLIDQTRRAAVSVILNIAEGYSRQSLKEKIRFLNIAYASANETQAAISIIQALSNQNHTDLDRISNEYEIIAKQLYLLKQKLKEASSKSPNP